MKNHRILGILLVMLGSCTGMPLLWRNRFMEGNPMALLYPQTGFHLSIDLFLIMLGLALLFLAVAGYYLYRSTRWAGMAVGMVAPLALTLWIIGLAASDPIDRLMADLNRALWTCCVSPAGMNNLECSLRTPVALAFNNQGPVIPCRQASLPMPC